MYERDYGCGNGLHPETRKRIREVFEGNRCCVCDCASERLFGGRFYCPEHYPKNRTRVRNPRVFHCAVSTE